MNAKLQGFFRVVLMLSLLFTFTACSPTQTTDNAATSVENAEQSVENEQTDAGDQPVQNTETGDRIEVSLWFHGGSVGESETLQMQVEAFNASQEQYKVVINEIPGGSQSGSRYNDAVNAAAVAGDLPDILDFDGPFLFNYAWGGYLLPLDDMLSQEVQADIFPSVLESLKYNGKLYGIGQYDSGLALVGNKSLLEKAGVRIPTNVDDAWTFDEFNEALEKVMVLEETEYAIDLKMNYGAGEWFTYAFSPIVWGMGGDLIDRSSYETAEGFVNGPETVKAVTWLQSLFEKGYAVATPPDDNEFINGKAALGWVGHWMTTGYYEALGDDFVLIPFPNFGKRQATCNGTWFWGVTKDSEHPEAAIAFIEFLMQPEEVLRTTQENGAVPATFSAIEQSDVFGEGGRLSIFAEQLARNDIATARPITPAYPVITSSFYTAIDNVIKGGDVQTELDSAADKINQDLIDNNFYPEK